METNKKAKFNVQCPRCQGVGRYDRGTCFQCKGKRFILTARKPSGEPKTLVVTFGNGTQNVVKMYFVNTKRAIMAVEDQVLVRGWTATVAEVA